MYSVISIKKKVAATTVCLLFAFVQICLTVEVQNPLVLQEMTWPEVRDYLKASDMVIIPLGSTEQHGPHLPLGTDFYQAFEMCKRISSETRVIVAPVLLSGYSVYHSGFQGSLSLKPETMEQVLYETVEILIKYGFRRFMFFNYHGGNRLAETGVIHRINQQTTARATAIGIGAPFQESGESAAPLDYHAGVGETSNMLYLKPDLVRKNRIEKPTLRLPPELNRIKELSKSFPSLLNLEGAYLGLPAQTGKGGASHEISSNGVWTLGDPKLADAEIGKATVEGMVKRAIVFISAWRRVTSK